MNLLYHKKQIKLGFVVICPIPNPGLLKTTLNSLRCNYWDCTVVTAIPEALRGIEFDKGGTIVNVKNDSVVSQINAGMAKSPCKEWNVIIQAGTWVRGLLDAKYSCFIESEKDILFPVMDRKTNFVDANWNGTMIHRKAVKDLGPFPDNKHEEFCKLMWATEAMEKTYRFKGIVGTTLR